MELLRHVDEISVGLGVFAFVVFIVRGKLRKREMRLEYLLLQVFAASTIPTGIALLFCAFEPALIAQLGGLNIHIAAAGLALLYLSFKSMFSKEERIFSDEDDDSPTA